MLAQVSLALPDINTKLDPNVFLEKRGKGSGHQVVQSGDTLEPYYYSYPEGVKITNVYVPDYIFDIDHDKANRKIYFSGIADGPARDFEIRIWARVYNDSLNGDWITRSGSLKVLRPYLTTCNTNFEIDSETLLDTIKLDYTKFTYAVWASDLPKELEFVKGKSSCSIVAKDYLKSGEYTFKVFGADSLYFSKDSIYSRDSTVKFDPKKYCDSITFNIKVYEGGLMKIGTGGTKQIVELGDSIEKFGFKWFVEGNLYNEAIPSGLEMVIDSTERDIWFQGAPTEIGTHEFEVAYFPKTSYNPIVYEIQVAVLPEIRPILDCYDKSTLAQVVTVGSMVSDIVVSYYNTDSIWVEGLPEGVRSEIDEENETLTIFGVLEKSGTYDVNVHARNAKYETELKVTLSTSDKAGDLSEIDDVLSEKEERTVVYDMLGRRVSPESLRGNSVFTIKKKIVIRK